MLTNEGEFILYSSQNTEIWKVSTDNNRTICAAMLDSGNFVLINVDSNLAWESFKEPTDTILPGQILSMGSKLRSRQSKTNYTNGRFQLHMQGDGNVVIYTVSVPTEVLYGAYWDSGTVHPNSTSWLTFSM